MRVALYFVIALVVVAPACGPGEAGQTVLVPTHEASAGEGEAARVVGVLQGDRNEDGGCLWVEQERTQYRGRERVVVSGPPGRIAVLFPAGYTARFDPPALVDPDGRVVAVAGDTVVLGGGADRAPEMTRCRFGQEWVFRVDHPVRRVDAAASDY